MHDGPFCHYNIEWPAAGAVVSGPQLLIKGWIVGKNGARFSDVRASIGGKIWFGLHGFPRADLAAHFKADKTWLPAGFALAANVPDGPLHLVLEARHAHGEWQAFHSLDLTISPQGEAPPEKPLRIVDEAVWRDTSSPFSGHLDLNLPVQRGNREPGTIGGWLNHEHQKIIRIFASVNLTVFHVLDHALHQHPVPHASCPRDKINGRFIGTVDLFQDEASCVRVYAELGDGSCHLVMAQRRQPSSRPEMRRAAAQTLPGMWRSTSSPLHTLPSGRPRRLTLGIRHLYRSDSTLRALDLVRYLRLQRQWVVHVVSTVEGPLRQDFEAALAVVQIVDPGSLYAAAGLGASEAALAQLAREVRWPHTDAAIIFDPLCFWMLLGAKKHRVPALFDCSEETPLSLYFSDLLAPGANSFVDDAWQSCRGVIFSSTVVAASQADIFKTARTIVPHWAGAEFGTVSQQEARSRLAFPRETSLAVSLSEPLPEQGSPALLELFSSGKQTGYLSVPASSEVAAHRRFTLDVVFNGSRILVPTDDRPALWLSAADIYLNLAVARPHLRGLLDAAAAGVRIITTDTPSVREIFNAGGVIFIPSGQPEAALQALAMVRSPTAPDGPPRGSSFLPSQHAADALLPRYVAFLETVVAAACGDQAAENHLHAGPQTV